MTFMQQWGGVLVVAAFVAISILGILAKRWTNRFTNKMIANTQKQSAYGARGKNMDFLLQDMTKGIVFAAGADQVAAVVTPAIGKPWIVSGPQQWAIPVSKKDPALAQIVVLEPTPGGSRLALVRAADVLGVPEGTTEWVFLRQAALKAALAAGIDAREEPSGQPFVRVPDRDVTGLSTAELARVSFSWQRSGGAA
jgi:hypothetical protein